MVGGFADSNEQTECEIAGCCGQHRSAYAFRSYLCRLQADPMVKRKGGLYRYEMTRQRTIGSGPICVALHANAYIRLHCFCTDRVG
jgi:hypothetical protein